MNRKQTECILRLYHGIQQLKLHPYTGIPVIVLTSLFIMGWLNKGKLFSLQDFSDLLRPIFQYSISIALILGFLAFLLAWIGWLGCITAKRDENRLMKAFTEHDRRNGCPILIRRRKLKGTDVTERVFYSDIPLTCWEERKDELEHQFSSHFIRLEDYGGKKDRNSKLILIHLAPGKKAKDRGLLYDEEL